MDEMASETSVEIIQSLLDRLADPATRPAAVRELIAWTYDRFRRLAARILYGSFPRVAARHDLDSVVNEAYIRLAKALETVTPETPADYFRVAVHKIRQTLLDLVVRDRIEAAVLGRGFGKEDDSNAGIPIDPATSTWDPARLAIFTEFHRKVDELPKELKDLYVMKYYAEMSQAEIAVVLGIPPKQVSRLHASVVRALSEHRHG